MRHIAQSSIRAHHMLLWSSQLGTIGPPVADHATMETTLTGRWFRADTDPVPIFSASVAGVVWTQSHGAAVTIRCHRRFCGCFHHGNLLVRCTWWFLVDYSTRCSLSCEHNFIIDDVKWPLIVIRLGRISWFFCTVISNSNCIVPMGFHDIVVSNLWGSINSIYQWHLVTACTLSLQNKQ